MPKVSILIKGTDKDHSFQSPQVDQQEAEEQLKTIREAIGRPDGLELSWITCSGVDIVTGWIEPNL
jgi:hypothetical protein